MKTFWASSPLSLACFFWLAHEWTTQSLPLRRMEVAVLSPSTFASVGSVRGNSETDNSVRLGVAHRLEALLKDGFVKGCWYRCASCYNELSAYKRGRVFPCRGCGSQERILVLKLNAEAVSELVGAYKLRDSSAREEVSPPPPELFPQEDSSSLETEKSPYEAMITGANIPVPSVLPSGWSRNEDDWPVNQQGQVCDPRTLQPLAPSVVPLTVGVPAIPQNMGEVSPVHMMASDPVGMAREAGVSNLNSLARTGHEESVPVPFQQQLVEPTWVRQLESSRKLVLEAFSTGQQPWKALGNSLGTRGSETAHISGKIYGPTWPEVPLVQGVHEAVARCAAAWLGEEVDSKVLTDFPPTLRRASLSNPYDEPSLWIPMSGYLAQQEAMWGFRLPLEIQFLYSWFNNVQLSSEDEVLVSWEWMMEAMIDAVKPRSIVMEQQWLSLPHANSIYERMCEVSGIRSGNHPHSVVLVVAKALANAIVISDIGRLLKGAETIFSHYE